MDAAPCGRFKLAFKFKQFTVAGPYQIFLFFVWQFSYSSASISQGFARFFHTYPLHSFCSVGHASRGQVSGEGEVFFKSSLFIWGMLVVHSSSSHPSSTRSSISSLHSSLFFGRGGGHDVITSYHHCRVRGLLPAILIFLINNFNVEGNSVTASSSSLRIAWFISLISSRNVSMEVREVRVSSLLEFSLHCSISSSILLTVLCMVSFTFRSPKGVPCVFQVSSRLSHALVV